MAMAAMKVVSAVGFLGVTYLMTKYLQGVAGPVPEKRLVFVVRLPKLDHLTVCSL
jgi:hypothetical protein